MHRKELSKLKGQASLQTEQSIAAEIAKLEKEGRQGRGFKWVYDEPVVKLTAAEEAVKAVELRALVTKIKSENPALTDEELRTEIKKDAEWAFFAQRDHHEFMFNNITSNDCTDIKFEFMIWMLQMKAKVEKGELTQEQATAQVHAKRIELKNAETKKND